MPTYTVDGVKYKSDVPLTDEELEELASPKVGADSAVTKPSYLAEAARKGITGFPSKVYGAFKGALTGTGQTGAQQAVRESQESMMGMLGGTGAKPETMGQKILASGVESLASPETYVMPSAKFIETAGMLTKPVLKGVEAFVTGSGAEAGGTAGEFAGKKIGGETGAQVGRVAGALGGGMLSSVALGGVPRTATIASNVAEPIINKLKSQLDKFKGVTAEDQYAKEANRHVENIFIAAASSDPNFLRVIEEAAAAQKATGVKLPLNSLLKDNPVINNYISSLASSNPEFRKVYSANFEAAENALRARADKMFGRPQDAGAVLGGEKDLDITGAVARRQQALSRKAAAASAPIKPVDPFEFGAKVVDVTDAAEKAAKASTTPLYTKAFEIGRSKGVGLSEDAVGDIYGYVAGEKANDIFKTFPSIYGKVVSAFKPKVTEGANLIDEMGRPLGSQTGERFAAATLEDLDSLKREVNSQLRRTKTDAEVRLLTELKGKVNQHIDELDPAFRDAYRAADAEYLKRVGLPFNEETINMIARAKFDENVVPLLTKNKSTLSQFIDATGNNGKALAEQAFVSDLHKSAVKDGVLIPSAAKKWLADNESALQIIPDARERIQGLTKNVQQLTNAKSALDSKFIRNAQDRIAQVEGMTPQQIVNKLYSEQGYADKLVGRLNTTLGFSGQQAVSQDGLKAIRSFLLDDIISSGKPIEVLNDRTKAAVLNRVFGPTYADQVKKLAVVADRLTFDPANVVINAKTVDKDLIEAITGSSPQRAYSLLVTNPVVSKEVAFISLLNRYFNKQATDATNKEMQKVLLDTEMAAGIFKSLQQRGKINFEDFRQAAQSTAKKTGMDFAEMLVKDLRAGAVRAGVGMDEEQQ